MTTRKYILTIKGTVSYAKEESQIEALLLGGWGSNAERVEVAFQELEEAEELQVKMEPIDEEE